MTVAPALPEIGKSFEANGLITNYHDTGSGPPVLLIHGSGPGVTAWANWRLVLPRLADHYRVIAPDMAGFGYTSTPPTTTHDIDLWVDQLIALLDMLELQQVAVVGNSFGGAIALHFATRHPERVSRIVLMGSVGVPFDMTAGLEKVWGYEPSIAAMKELLGIFAYNQEIATDELAELRFRASIRADVHARFAALFPAPRQRWIDFLAVEPGKLQAIDQPVLLVHGRDDRVIPLETSQKLARLIPHARLEVIDRCGHWVQIEYPDRFAELLINFLKEDGPDTRQ